MPKCKCKSVVVCGNGSGDGVYELLIRVPKPGRWYYQIRRSPPRAETAEARIVSLLYELGNVKDRAEAAEADADRLAGALVSCHEMYRPVADCECSLCAALAEHEALNE